MTSDDLPSQNCKNSNSKKKACSFLPDCRKANCCDIFNPK